MSFPGQTGAIINAKRTPPPDFFVCGHAFYPRREEGKEGVLLVLEVTLGREPRCGFECGVVNARVVVHAVERECSNGGRRFESGVREIVIFGIIDKKQRDNHRPVS